MPAYRAMSTRAHRALERQSRSTRAAIRKSATPELYMVFLYALAVALAVWSVAAIQLLPAVRNAKASYSR